MDQEFPLVREAHNRNDETIERIYIGRRFKNDRQAFLQALNRFSVSPFQTNVEELTEEVSLQHLKTEPPQRNFLLTVAALGESGQSNISESDEEILRNEIDPIYGITP